MRPALLVVVMDFLVSSLLLFVSGPGTAGSARRGTAPFEELPAAEEFSPAAVAAMEQQWRGEYERQLHDLQLVRQHARLEERTMALEQERLARAELEAAKRRLEAERLRQQQESAELQVRLRELADDKGALESQYTALAAEREQTDADLRQLARERDTLDRQMLELRDRLRAQASTINAQHRAIASQQQVIDEALADLNLAQTRLESKTDVLSTQQDRMQTVLHDVQRMIEKLPGEFQSQARELAVEQQRLNLTVAEMGAALREAGRELDQAAGQRAAEQMALLTAMQRDLQEELRDLLESGSDPELKTQLHDVQQRQVQLQDGIYGLAGRLEEMQTKQAGPFARLRDAVLPLDSRLAATQDMEVLGPRDEVYRNRVYLPLLQVNDAYWLALHGRDMGLGWAAALPFVNAGQWQVSVGEKTIWQSGDGGAALLYGEPVLVRIALAPDTVAALLEEQRMQPMSLTGREQIVRRGTRDVFLVKRHADGAAFAVTVSPDQSRPDYLKVRRALRPWANFVRRLWASPGADSEPGDFLVTAEGALIGIMVDDQYCRILDEGDFGPSANPLPLTDLRSLWRMVAPMRRALQ